MPLKCRTEGPSVWEWYEDEVAEMEKARAMNPPRSGAIVFYGSSSIRLWHTLDRDFPDRFVLNTGFGGSTLAACAHFVERLVFPLQPNSVVVYAGDNDLGDGHPPETVRDSWVEFVRRIDWGLGQIPILFLSIKPSPARWGLLDRIKATNALIREELQRRPSSVYVDLFHSMLTPEGQPRTELYAEDGLHLSPIGYRLWGEVVAPHLARLG